MNRASIRLRITAIAAAAVAVVLLVASLLLVTVLRGQLTANLDATLTQRAEDIAGLVGATDPIQGELAGGGQEGFAQLVDTFGRVIASTANLQEAHPLPVYFDAEKGQLIQTVRGLEVDDDVFRVLSRTVATPAGIAVLHVGTTFDVVAESAAVLQGTLALAVPVVLALDAGLVWWLVGRTLEPVEAIRAEVAEIGGSDLHRRVPEPPYDDEIGRLAQTMNQMLERLAAAVEVQKRFVADASHELRSPLTRLRAAIEVEISAPDGGKRHILRSLLDDVIELQGIVEDLLDLARADSGGAVSEREAVDLDDIVFREAERLRAGDRVRVDVSRVSGAQVLGDARQLTRAVRNLCDNAGRHAVGQVTMTLVEDGATAILTVADDGPGIAPDRVDFVFERFSRLDDSRAQTTGGIGLGLAIAREIVGRHNGTIEIDKEYAPGARVAVELPLA